MRITQITFVIYMGTLQKNLPLLIKYYKLCFVRKVWKQDIRLPTHIRIPFCARRQKDWYVFLEYKGA